MIKEMQSNLLNFFYIFEIRRKIIIDSNLKGKHNYKINKKICTTIQI